MKQLSIASAIFDPSPKSVEPGESHVDTNSSLPFILQSSSFNSLSALSTFDSSYHSFHPFALQQDKP